MTPVPRVAAPLPAARLGQEHHAHGLSCRVAVRLHFLVNLYVELRDADHSSQKTGHGRDLLTATVDMMAILVSLCTRIFIVDPSGNLYTPRSSSGL